MVVLPELKMDTKTVHMGVVPKGAKMAHLGGVEDPKMVDFLVFLVKMADFKRLRAKHLPGPSKSAIFTDFTPK